MKSRLPPIEVDFRFACGAPGSKISACRTLTGLPARKLFFRPIDNVDVPLLVYEAAQIILRHVMLLLRRPFLGQSAIPSLPLQARSYNIPMYQAADRT